ncbi:hypothetical protein EYZ11_004012 [Aspergillus tanneri]|uniref:Uncharacterized protein n=1 Tax=Aspergillus tanneri TaxID=1220188 RepID=A0A4S3JM00_9EURO|nr:hypothetical protein EYZ11_004012 [Aspergillus tanneri]
MVRFVGKRYVRGRSGGRLVPTYVTLSGILMTL